jgi:TPR repeat protein
MRCAARSGGRTCHAVANLTRDEARQLELLLQGCATGAGTRCVEDGLALYDVAPEEAFAWFEAACAGGNARGCTNLGILYRNGTGVEADAAQAAALYRQGCDGGEPLGVLL